MAFPEANHALSEFNRRVFVPAMDEAAAEGRSVAEWVAVTQRALHDAAVAEIPDATL